MQVAGEKRTPERHGRLNGLRRFIIWYHLHASPCVTSDKPKLKFTLSPAGSGDTESDSVRFFAGAARAVLYREQGEKAK